VFAGGAEQHVGRVGEPRLASASTQTGDVAGVPAGDYQAQAIADFDDEVNNPNRGNNAQSGSLTIGF
jgi:hypothetical protein